MVDVVNGSWIFNGWLTVTTFDKKLSGRVSYHDVWSRTQTVRLNKQCELSYLAPADDIRIHCEQVHNFSFALVAPLSPEHDGHFVLRLLRDAESRNLRGALPRPLHDRLPVQGDGLPSVNVSHGAVGCHAAEPPCVQNRNVVLRRFTAFLCVTGSAGPLLHRKMAAFLWISK